MNLSALDSGNPKVKYACVKQVVKTAKDNPKDLVKDYNFFLELLNENNNILKWTAIEAIGGVVSVTGSKEGFRILIEYLDKGKMITAGHAVDALARIAIAKPEFKEKVINALLKVPNFKYDTVECNRVLCSRVIATLELLGAEGKKVESFLKSQSRSKRLAVKKRVVRLLSKLKKSY